MKKFLLFALLLGGIWGTVVSQNRSISFEPRDWKKVVAKAKKENKLIFLDCHTSWCGPCKNLAKNIFTRDAVADFYNRNFINVAMDMEKDVDGVMLSKVYKPTAYPTLLFIDPYTGLVVHQVTGGGDVAYILSIGMEALNSDNTLAGHCKRYKSGDRSPAFVKKLMDDLKLAGVKDLHREVTETYFDSLNESDWVTEESWELFKKHVDNPYSRFFRKVINNRKAYESFFGEKQVAVALQWVVIMELGNIADQVTHTNTEEGKVCYERLIGLLARIDFPGSTALLTDLYFSRALLNSPGDAWRVIQNGYQYNLTGDEFYGIDNAWVLYPMSTWVSVMNDQVVLAELLSLIDRIKLRCSSMPYLARLALDRFLILKRSGDEEGAMRAWTEYEQYCTMR